MREANGCRVAEWWYIPVNGLLSHDICPREMALWRRHFACKALCLADVVARLLDGPAMMKPLSERYWVG